MKDDRHHPTIAGLATAFAGAAPAPVEPSVPPPVEAMPVAAAALRVETAVVLVDRMAAQSACVDFVHAAQRACNNHSDFWFKGST
ncbi:MAG: hypothetical protein ACJ73J_12975 [Actinomycetes bacterium]